MKTGSISITIILGIILLAWLGLNINPSSFPPYPQQSENSETIPLPDDLPKPVKRFYQQVYRDRIPVITTTVITGKAELRLPSQGGITFPGRFRFVHNAGNDYRHYIEATIFGTPIMTVNEYFLDGKSRLELPFGVSDGPKVDQGANLALWAEAMWFPSVWVTDSRVRWEAIDTNSAYLIVPFEDTEERIQVWFDPDTGLLEKMESMRFKETTSENKTSWLNEAQEWTTMNGYRVPSVGAITWGDESSPWATFFVEEIDLNVDLATYNMEADTN